MFKKKTPTPASQPYRPMTAEAAAFPPIGSTLPQPGYYQSRTYQQPPARPALAPQKKSWKSRIKRIFIVLLVLGFLAGAFVGVKLAINASKAFDGNLFGLLQNDKLKGEDQGRVNILLAGNSADDPGHAGADLTDSLLLLSIDTDNKRAFMMSIPRDLYVDIPDNGYAKINEVYADGKESGFSEAGYPDGGMGLLEKVVGQNFGIDIHYYALINYTAFREAVNAVGGIDVNIQSDDPRGLYDAMIAKADGGPLRLKNGPQTLDGQTALNLARARGSGINYGFAQSDYTRSEHQRMMLVALKEKAASAGVVSNPVKLSSLLDSFGNNVTTDFQTSEVRRLYDLSKEIPSASITSVGLNDVEGKSLLASYRTRSGQSALVPKAGVDDYSEIQAYLTKLMTPPAPPAGSAENDSTQSQ